MNFDRLAHTSNASEPPPAPPLPPTSRPSVFERFIGPLNFRSTSAKASGSDTAQSSSASPRDTVPVRATRRRYSAKGAHYRTGIPITAVDINEHKTHAILAGRDILRTVKVQDRNIFEELNLRKAVTAYISTQQLRPDEALKRRDFLPAKDVKWSHKHYAHIVATAAQHGRIALYDVSRLSSRVELCHLYQHTSQVNKIDFDPHAGYMLLSGSQDRYCRIWDIREPKKPKGYAQYNVRSPVRDVRWCPNDAYEFALCTEDGFVQKWDIRKPQQVLISIKAHEKPCYSLAWHPDGKHVVSGGLDKSLKVWDLKNENRRQKPVIQLRCPAGVMNVAWRPPCWSAEFAERGSWQSTQVATCYTDEDPRLHVWDLRRPFIPFREVSSDEKRPTDVLWASKDLLWTVDGGGTFAQTDVTTAPQPEDSLPPGAIAWAPDKTFYAVTEDRIAIRQASAFDPAALFLNIPQERLSGAEGDFAISRSLTDDEGPESSLSAGNISRRVSRATSTRSAKSQANTPPTHDDTRKVLPLDRAIMARKDLFTNGQIGAMTRLPGIHLPVQLVEALLTNYVPPMTAQERNRNPNQIIEKLKYAFESNAQTCMKLGMREVCASWRLAMHTIIPELEAWADNNRKRRLAQKSEEAAQEERLRRNSATKNTLSAFSKLSQKDKITKSPTAMSDKVMSNLFRGIVDQLQGSTDTGSHSGSNMSTPRQLATTTSPRNATKSSGTWYTIEDTIEPINDLPPSLAQTHATAAVASRALLDNTSEATSSPVSSPEKSRSSPAPYRTHEERRAALRDYRVPSRQILTFDSVLEPSHDSAESFQMFSAESGSQRGSVGGQDFVPGSLNFRPAPTFGEVQNDSYYESVGRSSSGQVADFEMDESPSQNFGLDGNTDSKPAAAQSVERRFRAALAQSSGSKEEVPRKKQGREPELSSRRMDAAAFKQQCEEAGPRWPYTRGKNHNTNPYLQATEEVADKMEDLHVEDPSKLEPYIASDFRPIDITIYEPWQPWPLSAYSLMGMFIENDSLTGVCCSHFSVNLLSHIHPFFFDLSTNKPVTSTDVANMPSTTADRFQHPAFRQRHIQGLFAKHIDYLENLRLFLLATKLRKLCVEEFGYGMLASRTARSTLPENSGEHLQSDPRRLRVICTNCSQPMSLNKAKCDNCGCSRPNCPICEIPLNKPSGQGADTTISALVSYCHTCGHSTHTSCISKWLATPGTEGECPTPGCGCDCAPGEVREERITRQAQEREERDAIRGSSLANLRKDSLKASLGPAIDKARDTLRKSSLQGGRQERAAHSGDEGIASSNGPGASAWSKKGTSAGRPSLSGAQTMGRSNSGSGVGTSTSFARRVRLIEPDEEDAQA